MTVDVRRVRGKMAERGYTITSLANQIGIDRNTLSKYLRKPESMTYEVICKLCDALADTPQEAASLFFS